MALRIENAIDLHCHFGPDTIGRKGDGAVHYSVTGYDAAREAYESGHKAIVLKSHSFCSSQLAANLQQVVTGLQVFGGACTDHASGGLSVDAIESALILGAKIIWLPTVNSCEDMRHRTGSTRRGIAVVDENGEPNETVRAIFALVRENDAVLATGHIGAAEHFAVTKAFARHCKLLVTHAGEALAGPNLSPQQAKELADLGATIELTAECCVQVFDRPPKSAETMAQMIRTIGHERCTLSSDYGWSTAVPHPAAGLKDFLEKLWQVGVSETELARMVSTNPSRLLSIN